MVGICLDCATNLHLKRIIKEHKEKAECSECGEEKWPAVSVESLAAVIEPIMREHFKQGKFDDGGQDGDGLEWVVANVLDQEFECVPELIQELIALDPADPSDGGDVLWDKYAYYVETAVQTWQKQAEWSSVLEELKYSRRFFSSSASSLFVDLFANVGKMRIWQDGEFKPAVLDLPAGTSLHRARVCSASLDRSNFFANPERELGPPPSAQARAGRMNAEGVSVLYAAVDAKTAVAEMRPAIATELVVATFKTTEALRVLDFSRLEEAFGEELTYLQPDFNEQVERNHFLRRLHKLISQPVVPGREADYLITQTMAEFLAHVVHPPFAGVLFRSAQHEGGTNVVLFRKADPFIQDVCEAFSISYEPKSLKVIEVRGVTYAHRELEAIVRKDGAVSLYSFEDDYDDDPDW